MKIAFIGIGNVGGTLAKKLGNVGHSIYLGARDPKDPSSAQLALSIGSHASVESISNAIKKAEVVFLATPWEAVKDLTSEHKAALSGKVIVDCTNPLLPELAGLDHLDGRSGAEQIQGLLPDSLVVKAFNTTGYNIMAEPMIDGRKAVLYYCGNHEESKHTIRTLIEDVGFEPVDGGPLRTARLLESFALLWIQSAYQFGFGREFAFGLLRRSPTSKGENV